MAATTAYKLCILSIILFTRHALTACQCYGIDYVHGGGPYFINSLSTDYFSFLSESESCSGVGIITPLLISPNGEEYFCSDIATAPDDADKLSICNVPGNEVLKSSMVSGNWTIVNAGANFAFMRTFSIVAGCQSTVTICPTTYFNTTITPTTVRTTTLVKYIATTLEPVLVTAPSTTVAITTITPAPVISTCTNLITSIQTTRSFSMSLVTTTETATCAAMPYIPKSDPSCTILPSRINLSDVVTTAVPLVGSSKRRDSNRMFDRVLQRRDKNKKRQVDSPTVTTTALLSAVSITSTCTAPVFTDIAFFLATSIETVVPPPIVVADGTAMYTFTASTPTQVVIAQATTTSLVTKNFVAT